MMPNWSFGHPRGRTAGQRRESAQSQSAELVVLLSHNGFDVDRKLAAHVAGIDVILTGHTHDALPDVMKVGRTLLIASGSHGKFVSRLDLDVRDGEVKDYRFKLIPIFSDVIAPDAEMAAKIGADPCAAPKNVGRSRRPDRDAALPTWQLQRHARRCDLRCVARLNVTPRLRYRRYFRWGQFVCAARPGQSPGKTFTTLRR